MSVMAFDTLKFAKTLREAGLPETQAEAIAGGFGEGLREHVATKGDLDLVESRLSGRMNELEAQLGGRIDKVETRLDSLEWMMRLVMGGIAALVVGMAVAFIRGFGGG